LKPRSSLERVGLFALARVGLLALALVAAGSCAPRRLAYHVLAPDAVTLDLPRVEGASLTSDRGRLTVRLRWPASDWDARVTEAWLAPAAAPPCEGRRAAELAVDGAASWTRPVVVGGEQALDVSFPVPPVVESDDSQAAMPATVDLWVEGRGPEGARCVRVPLPDPARWRRTGHWSWGGRVELEPPELPASSVVARLGRWMGPLRVGAELGVSLRACDACLSALYLGLPMALTAEVMPSNRAGIAVGLEAAYTARPLRGVGDGDRYFVHGPRVTLRLGGAAPRADGLPGGPQVRYGAFDVWWTRWTAVGVDHWSQTLFGVGWTWDEGF